MIAITITLPATTDSVSEERAGRRKRNVYADELVMTTDQARAVAHRLVALAKTADETNVCVTASWEQLAAERTLDEP